MITRESWSAGLPVLSRPLVMGVVNVTPDSFSDGGQHATTDAAIAHGLLLREQGADLLDIGGESTRPGATRPLVAEELDRVVPVIRALAAEGVAVSVDTMRHEVAEAALEAGAVLVNDVSGGLADPQVLDVVAEHGAAYVAMHWRAHSEVMQQLASYDDVLVEVRDELARRLEAAAAAGVDPGPAGRRPGPGVRQDRRRTTGSCCAAAGAGGARRADPGRLQPQVVPRLPARRPRRRPATGPRPGGRQRGAHHDRGDPGRVGGPGARGPGEPGRDQGRHPVARGRAHVVVPAGQGAAEPAGVGRPFRSGATAGSVGRDHDRASSVQPGRPGTGSPCAASPSTATTASSTSSAVTARSS